MAEQSHKSSNSSITVTVANDENDAAVQTGAPRVRLKLRKLKTGKKVNWTEETVDNENMDKKKSKCCCIYHKPRAPDESSSSEDDECEHCQGHVEKKEKKKKSIDTQNPAQEDSANTSMVVA